MGSDSIVVLLLTARNGGSSELLGIGERHCGERLAAHCYWALKERVLIGCLSYHQAPSNAKGLASSCERLSGTERGNSARVRLVPQR